MLAVWLAAVAVFARRQLRGEGPDALDIAAARVAPGTVYFVVEQGGQQIGYASTVTDTADGGLIVRDALVADVGVGGRRQRTTLRSRATLGAMLGVRDFAFDLTSEAGPLTASGSVAGDSLLTVVVRSGESPADTQRVRLDGRVLLPMTVPLAVGLRRPTLGDRAELRVFDPLSMAARPVVMHARAESLFVLADSVRFDSTAGRWDVVRRDTVRAWRFVSDGGAYSWWVDGAGQMVEAAQAGGFTLRRQPYELAFDNWRRQGAPADGVTDANDIIETSAVAANVSRRARLTELRVRLGGVPLTGFELDGGRQRLRDDTLTVRRENPRLLSASYTLPGDARHRGRFAAELAGEPLLQVRSVAVVARAREIAAGDSNPVRVAQKINAWLFASLAKEITLSVPDALKTLESRSGDCNEHTQLYVALARALGIPARAATGLAYSGGKFYYHAWPEVYLNRWVAVDPSFGQFPADAGHLRFVTGGLARQAALLGLIGRVRIEVLGESDGL